MRSPNIPPRFHTWVTSDGYELNGRCWPPRTVPATGILYLHGIQSHGGWFEWSAGLLAESGVAVLLVDRRGSGLNHAARGDAPCAERWLQDIDEYAAWATREYGIARFALLGVSWGGKLAAAWAARRPDVAGELLLVAPGFFPAVDLSPAKKMAVGLALLTGGRRHFEIPLNDPELFTNNPAGREFIQSDALRLQHVTARFLWHSRRLDHLVRRLRTGMLGSSVALFLAGKERIIRNTITEAWVRSACDTAKVQHFPQAAHTLEFESDETRYAAALRSWMASIGPDRAPDRRG
jgi:acylglycerol lipase